MNAPTQLHRFISGLVLQRWPNTVTRVRFPAGIVLALTLAGCAVGQRAETLHQPVIVNGWCDPAIARSTSPPSQPLDFGLCYTDGF